MRESCNHVPELRKIGLGLLFKANLVLHNLVQSQLQLLVKLGSQFSVLLLLPHHVDLRGLSTDFLRLDRQRQLVALLFAAVFSLATSAGEAA